MPYQQVLDLAALPGVKNVYALGLFAKRVTFFSQQARAINLVDAIHHYRTPLAQLRVAIVGAGAAGVTAAARAAKYRAAVSLFDKTATAISVQRPSAHRWIHPSIYDWPFSAVDPDDDRAGLPVMDWSASDAAQLSSGLAAQLDTLIASKRVTFVSSTEIDHVRVADDERVVLAWERAFDGAKGQDAFDVVILAIGFGLEPYNLKQNSYWEGDAIDNVARNNTSVLIVGYGDGALTDLMRACILNFRHDEVFKRILASTSDAATLQRIRAIEMHPHATRDVYLTERYSGLDVPALCELLGELRNPIRKVVLAGPGPYLFSAKASALNRLIVSQLFRLKAIHHVPFADGRQINGADPADPLLNEIVDRARTAIGETPAHTLLRFGPVSVAKRIGGIEQPLADLKARWESVSPAEDLTRERIWKSPVFGLPRDAETLLVMGTGPALGDLALVAGNALERLGLQTMHVAEVDVHACLSNRAPLLHTVSAICAAPIALFKLEPELAQGNLASLLLLGMRSVVRRGVSLVATDRTLDAEEWASVPFDLKELQILTLPHGVPGASVLANAISEARAILREEASSYRDTPVFDIVRRARRRTPELPLGETEVFTLCSFSAHHASSLLPTLRLLLEGVKRLDGGQLRLRRVRDYESSPLIVAERLYELIRFAPLCMVDFSEWRPNVLFELGVRLMVHGTPPICVIQEGDVADLAKGPQAHRELLEFFRPIVYPTTRTHERREEFQAAFAAELERRLARRQPTDTPHAAASRNVDLSQEHGGQPFHDVLRQQARAMLGADVVRSGRAPVIYGTNKEINQQALDATIEVLWASRLLIREQLGPRPDAGDPLLRSSLADVESQLKDLLRHSRSTRFDVLRAQLLQGDRNAR